MSFSFLFHHFGDYERVKVRSWNNPIWLLGSLLTGCVFPFPLGIKNHKQYPKHVKLNAMFFMTLEPTTLHHITPPSPSPKNSTKLLICDAL